MTLDTRAQLQAKALEMLARLTKLHGQRELKPRREPMHELISTMLSHRTTNANEALAYQQMWERFGSWEANQNAPVEQLTEAIKPSNFPKSKRRTSKRRWQRFTSCAANTTSIFWRQLPQTRRWRG